MRKLSPRPFHGAAYRFVFSFSCFLETGLLSVALAIYFYLFVVYFSNPVPSVSEYVDSGSPWLISPPSSILVCLLGS